MAVRGLAIHQVIRHTDADLSERPSRRPKKPPYGRFYAYPAYRLTVPPLPPAGRLRTHPSAGGGVLDFDSATTNQVMAAWLKLRKQRYGEPIPSAASREAAARQRLFITERGSAFTYGGVYRILAHIARRIGLTPKVFLVPNTRATALQAFGDLYDQPFLGAWEQLISGDYRAKRRRRKPTPEK